MSLFHGPLALAGKSSVLVLDGLVGVSQFVVVVFKFQLVPVWGLARCCSLTESVSVKCLATQELFLFRN